jgi:glycine cleavage system pyridoxal-binding protein P
MERNILGGLDLSNSPYRDPLPPEVDRGMLVCVTEMNTKQDIDALVVALQEIGEG